MDSEAARLIEQIITAAGGLVWIAGLWFVTRTLKRQRSPTAPGDPRPGKPDVAETTGTVELEGRAGELAARAASALATTGGIPSGFVKVLEKTEDRVVFERTEGMGFGFRRGTIRFISIGSNRTRVAYALEQFGGRWMLWAAGGCLLLGLIALVAGYFLVQTHVVPSPDPKVRSQVFQGLQVVHFLWPPFLFAGIHRRVRRLAHSQVDTLIHNLRYIRD